MDNSPDNGPAISLPAWAGVVGINLGMGLEFAGAFSFLWGLPERPGLLCCR